MDTCGSALLLDDWGRKQMNQDEVEAIYLQLGLTEEMRARMTALAKFDKDDKPAKARIVIETIQIANGVRTVIASEGLRA